MIGPQGRYLVGVDVGGGTRIESGSRATTRSRHSVGRLLVGRSPSYARHSAGWLSHYPRCAHGDCQRPGRGLPRKVGWGVASSCESGVLHTSNVLRREW